ncbi:HemK2/MTQ2 family protein methyltransferase [Streptomyces sp. SAJ15]|uniref:HemK2/MTQ2 family protein methyltransferase n=1 Tax=Streptomyces sp. SAJ15 TaxID=2011095 RepID=UPI001186D9AD|nr:HemK2/MTQ2 family protein methyltransferase [Streptomyces sp. SAJ15]TVL91135.1 methyltransferase [Streptomyces sp. SAJ15]
MLLRPWGVYSPQEDSYLLRDTLAQVSVPPGARVLDVCTGTGLIAVTAARLGAGDVRAVDISYRAVLTARVNAWLNRAAVRVRHADFRDHAPGERFDLITANPPYVPCPERDARRPRGGGSRDAGPDGRRYLDRLCAMAPLLLNETGVLLVVHSSVAEPLRTLRALTAGGLTASVVARRAQPFGPLLSARAAWMEDSGLIDPGQRHEELVVIRGARAPERP